MPSAPVDHAQSLLNFNQHLLEQALTLVVEHGAPGAPPFAGPAGAHLRHVAEHYEALVFPAQPGVVDYDARPRDIELETDMRVASRRLQSVHQALGQCTTARLHEALQVRGRGGPEGEFAFLVPSSLGRELAFLASHTVHHFALLCGYCQQHGIATPEGFGKAPATRAHERRVRIAACA